MRWFCVCFFCQDHGITGPVFAPDWDTLIFQDMVVAESRLGDYDYSVALNAQHVSHPSVLASFYWMAIQCVKRGKGAFRYIKHEPNRQTGTPTWSDMEIWEVLRARLGLSSVPVGEVRDNTVFDDIIQVFPDETQFELDESDLHIYSGRVSKRVVWEQNKPHFILNGNLVKANTIHCWGNYRVRTAELLERAGL